MGLDMDLFDKNKKELCYWRKANQVHYWFVQNIQNGIDNCNVFPVSKEKLKELLTLCEKVVKNSKLIKGYIQNGSTIRDGKVIPIYEKGYVISDPSIAKELLPTHKGFYFGSYNYDSYYIDQLKETIKFLKEILSTFTFNNNTLYYQSSW